MINENTSNYAFPSSFPATLNSFVPILSGAQLFAVYGSKNADISETLSALVGGSLSSGG